MKGHGLVQFSFPYTAQRYNLGLAFTKKKKKKKKRVRLAHNECYA